MPRWAPRHPKRSEMGAALDEGTRHCREPWRLGVPAARSAGPVISITPGGIDTVTAQPFAQKFHDLAAKEATPSDQLFGERMMGVGKYFLGDQVGARRHLEQVLAHHAAADHGRDVSFRVRFQVDCAIARRACSWRGCCGCRGFRIRQCERPRGALARRRQRVTQFRCVTPSLWRHARSRCGWATWPPRSVIQECCSIVRDEHGLAALERPYGSRLASSRVEGGARHRARRPARQRPRSAGHNFGCRSLIG